MSFRLIYIDNGDVVAQEESYERAYTRLRAFLQTHPELDDEIGIQEIDSAGKPVGNMTIGLELAGQQLQLN